MDGVRLEECIARAFYPVHWAMKDEAVREVWLKGGRGSTKSSFLALEIVLGLLKYEGSNAIVYRKVADTLRDSVYAQLVWAIDKLGVSALFHCKVSPMEIVRPQTGQRILFRGADDPQKSKGVMLPKGYFRYLWFEELTEFAGMKDVHVIRASVFRGCDHYACTLYSYNPPMVSRDWVNEEAEKRVKGRLVHHSTYLDVPRAWLGDTFLHNAEIMHADNEREYRHTYLGEITGTGGQVFTNIDARAVRPAEWQGLPTYSGLDFGFAGDPDAYIRLAYDRKRRLLYVVDEFVASGQLIEQLATEVKRRCQRDVITCDNADPRSIAQLRALGLRVIAARKGPDSIEHGLKWLQLRAKIILDPMHCPYAAKELRAYEYDRDKAGNVLPRYPDRDNHAIDAARYAMESVSNQRVAIASK